MQYEIKIDTEALVVDAYPKMREIEQQCVGADEFDVAWGFYCAMHKIYPEMMQAFAGRMHELINALRELNEASNGTNPWFTVDELNKKYGGNDAV